MHLASGLPELADTPDVLAWEAHKLRGSAGYAGAMRAAYFCGIVENAPNASPSRMEEGCWRKQAVGVSLVPAQG
jgi:hypothetical protein